MARPRRSRKPAPAGSSLAAPRSGESWQLQTAKARFSELFRRARTDGPQWVTRHETESVVVLPAEQFEELTRRRQPGSLAQFFAESPLAGVELDLERDRDVGRDIEL
jgi:prevent-host-death family protein